MAWVGACGKLKDKGHYLLAILSHFERIKHLQILKIVANSKYAQEQTGVFNLYLNRRNES